MPSSRCDHSRVKHPFNACNLLLVLQVQWQSLSTREGRAREGRGAGREREGAYLVHRHLHVAADGPPRQPRGVCMCGHRCATMTTHLIPLPHHHHRRRRCAARAEMAAQLGSSVAFAVLGAQLGSSVAFGSGCGQRFRECRAKRLCVNSPWPQSGSGWPFRHTTALRVRAHSQRREAARAGP